MQYALDEDGYIKDWLYDMEAYDGFDLYMGNDCSGGVYWAWNRIGCSFSFSFTRSAIWRSPRLGEGMAANSSNSSSIRWFIGSSV